jgi:hypothetical protein
MTRLLYSHRADPPRTRTGGSWVRPPRTAPRVILFAWVKLSWVGHWVRVAVGTDEGKLNEAALEFARKRDIIRPEMIVLEQGREPEGDDID